VANAWVKYDAKRTWVSHRTWIVAGAAIVVVLAAVAANAVIHRKPQNPFLPTCAQSALACREAGDS
jgi:hypothetical protein